MTANCFKILERLFPDFILDFFKSLYHKFNMVHEIRVFRKGKIEKGLKRWYKFKTGETLNLDNPKKLTEKQQWLKLHGVTPEIVMCTDKFLVREYIKKTIGSKYLIPIISINGKDHFYNAEEIDFNKLPNSFVIQCNHGSKMTLVIKDKSKLNNRKIKSIKKKLNKWMKINFCFYFGYEMIYKDIKPCIFITKFLENENGLNDYKYMCFNGVPRYVWIDKDRFENHKRTTCNLDWTKAEFRMNTFEDLGNEFDIPLNSGEMEKVARILAKDFCFVRVDLYNIKGKIYFGELTFSSGGGVEFPYPKEYNLILGDMLKLPFEQ